MESSSTNPKGKEREMAPSETASSSLASGAPAPWIPLWTQEETEQLCRCLLSRVGPESPLTFNGLWHEPSLRDILGKYRPGLQMTVQAEMQKWQERNPGGRHHKFNVYAMCQHIMRHDQEFRQALDKIHRAEYPHLEIDENATPEEIPLKLRKTRYSPKERSILFECLLRRDGTLTVDDLRSMIRIGNILSATHPDTNKTAIQEMLQWQNDYGWVEFCYNPHYYTPYEVSDHFRRSSTARKEFEEYKESWQGGQEMNILNGEEQSGRALQQPRGAQQDPQSQQGSSLTRQPETDQQDPRNQQGSSLQPQLRPFKLDLQDERPDLTLPALKREHSEGA